MVCLGGSSDVHPDAILHMAQGHLQEVLVIGLNHEGGLWVSGSTAELSRIHWLASRVAAKCLGDSPFQGAE